MPNYDSDLPNFETDLAAKGSAVPTYDSDLPIFETDLEAKGSVVPTYDFHIGEGPGPRRRVSTRSSPVCEDTVATQLIPL